MAEFLQKNIDLRVLDSIDIPAFPYEEWAKKNAWKSCPPSLLRKNTL
jgi:hypothetical protein